MNILILFFAIVFLIWALIKLLSKLFNFQKGPHTNVQINQFANDPTVKYRTIKVSVAGVTYEGRQDKIRNLTPNTPLALLHIPSVYDKNAVEVRTLQNIQIGFLPRWLAEDMALLLDEGRSMYATVLEITGGTKGKENLGCLIQIFIKHKKRQSKKA